jgi:hypothetical protein
MQNAKGRPGRPRRKKRRVPRDEDGGVTARPWIFDTCSLPRRGSFTKDRTGGDRVAGHNLTPERGFRGSVPRPPVSALYLQPPFLAPGHFPAAPGGPCFWSRSLSHATASPRYRAPGSGHGPASGLLLLPALARPPLLRQPRLRGATLPERRLPASDPLLPAGATGSYALTGAGRCCYRTPTGWAQRSTGAKAHCGRDAATLPPPLLCFS